MTFSEERKTALMLFARAEVINLTRRAEEILQAMEAKDYEALSICYGFDGVDDMEQED